ncbi:hypothetical protein [Rhodovulum imhoffii]|uniref:hypothetical protein n=1 Tax=Rhodovulum imhoffii TaxID=365340 RepID=UPI000D35178F|nr:hypothetical protein [Rhodovulum imhoffii]
MHRGRCDLLVHSLLALGGVAGDRLGVLGGLKRGHVRRAVTEDTALDHDRSGVLSALLLGQVGTTAETDRTPPLLAFEQNGVGVGLDLPERSGEHQLRNQEVFYGKREQTDAGVSA